MSKKRKFPTLAVVLLAVAVLWLLNDLQVIEVKVPWIPVVLIILALGWIINRYSE